MRIKKKKEIAIPFSQNYNFLLAFSHFYRLNTLILGQFPCFSGIFHIKPLDRPIFLNYPENLQLLAFAVARNCGRPLLSLLFSEKLIAKYSDWTERNDRFARLFALAIFFPVAPDDFLCYLAGTTSMTWRRFTTIILLGKPLSIALYSLGLTVLFQQITGWLG